MVDSKSTDEEAAYMVIAVADAEIDIIIECSELLTFVSYLWWRSQSPP